MYCLERLGLIPDPMDSKFSYALELVNWIWDQGPILIPDPTLFMSKLRPIINDKLDLGSVINDCEDKHYNTVGA